MAITLRSVGASPGANSSTCSITKPAGLAVGDFMLAHVVNKATSGTITPPANWAIIGAQSNTASSRSALFYKFADAADVAASTFDFTLGTTGRNRGEIGAWLGVHTSTPINAANQQINAAGTSIAVPSITVTDLCKVLIFGSNALGGVATACSGTNPVCTITAGYAVAYSSYCALACFSGVKSGTDAIDAHSLSTFTSAVSSGHAVALNPQPPAIDLITNEGVQLEISDTPALSQVHNLIVAEGAQAQASDAPALTQTHNLGADKGYQAQASDGPALSQEHNLAAQEGVQALVSDEVNLGGAVDLMVAEGVQEQVSDEARLDRIVQLMADDGHQEQLSDAAMLDLIIQLVIQEGHQEQVSDSAALAFMSIEEIRRLSRIRYEVDKLSRIAEEIVLISRIDREE